MGSDSGICPIGTKPASEPGVKLSEGGPVHVGRNLQKYKITLKSELQASSSKWRPMATIWPKDMRQKLPTGHQIDSGELQDTEALANPLALRNRQSLSGC
jgi:hypothetical protein